MPEIQARMPDGKILSFPDGTADAVIDKTAKDYISSLNKPSAAEKPGFLESVLKSIASATTFGAPAPAGVGEILNSPNVPALQRSSGLIQAGAAIGATALTGGLGAPASLALLAGSAAPPITDQIIRHYQGQDYGTSILGNKYQSPVGPIIEGTLINEAGGRLLHGIAKGVVGSAPANINPELSNLGSTPGQLIGKDTTTGRLINFVEDTLARPQKEASIIESGQKAVKRAGEFTQSAQPILIQTGTEASEGLIDKLLRKDNKALLQNFLNNGEVIIQKQKLTSSNARKDIQGYIMDKIFTNNRVLKDSMDLTKVSLNGDKMMSDFADVIAQQEKTGVQLFSQQDNKNFSDFIKAVQTSTEIGDATRFLKVNLLTRTLGLGGAIVAERTSGIASGLGVIGGYLSLGQVARLLTNRKAAPVVLNMVKGAPLGMSVQAGARLLVNALTGQKMTLLGKDGKEIPATVGTDGLIRPTQ